MNILKINNCLLSCLKPNQLEHKEQLLQLDQTEWKDLVSFAIQQKIESWLYQTLKQLDILTKLPVKQLERLHLCCRKGTARNLQIYGELGQITKKFNQHDIPVIVLKGAYLAHSVYPKPSLRRMVDCDILVREENLSKAVKVLTQLGYQASTPVQFWDKSMLHHLPPFQKEKSKPEVELHWTIIPPTCPQKINITNLWKRTNSYPVKGGNALTLCPEDTLLHICFHATYQHLFLQGYRSLVDIALLVAHFDSKHISIESKDNTDTERKIDWQTVCERSRLWGCSKGTYLMLYLTYTMLNVDIPPHVLTNLKPDNLSDDVIEAAKTCLFMAEEGSNPEDFSFAQIMKNRSLYEKIQLAFNQLFLSRQELAGKYELAENSPWIYCYYPQRFWHLLLKGTQYTWNYLFKMDTIKNEINKRNQISLWLKRT